MINYNAEGVALPSLDRSQLTQWIESVAAVYGRQVGEVNYIFVSDERILEINRQFLHHDYYTDHIGFDYSAATVLSGDLFLSLDTIRTNADAFSVPYEEELHRVIIHGILHLCGFCDKTEDEQQRMRAAEDSALAMLLRMKI